MLNTLDRLFRPEQDAAPRDQPHQRRARRTGPERLHRVREDRSREGSLSLGEDFCLLFVQSSVTRFGENLATIKTVNLLCQ